MQMRAGIEPLPALSSRELKRLHRGAVEGREAVGALMGRLCREGTVLWQGLNRMIERETARIQRVEGDRLLLRGRNFERGLRDGIYLNFELEGVPYFFSAPRLDAATNGRMVLGLPDAVFLAERRGVRRATDPLHSTSRVELRACAGSAARASVVDWSEQGLAVVMPEASAGALEGRLSLRWMDGEGPVEAAWAEVRHRMPAKGQPGWVRLGLSVSQVAPALPLPVDHRKQIVEKGRLAKAREQISIARGTVRVATDRVVRRLGAWRTGPTESVPIVDYETRAGEKISAILDCWGTASDAPVVVVPPAWGRTKETLLPLAVTIGATFERAGQPIKVLRFDGVRRRGESHNDPGCTASGHEYHRFTFTQAVRDIEAALDFIDRSPDLDPSKVVLVTFSAAAIEGRRAVALEHDRIAGWISVVGLTDLQSSMRIVSGGVDYAYGLQNGVRFGLQEILGVVVDMDHAGLDAIANDLAFMEDAKRDMESISTPLTWIHGRHDAWTDLERVRELLGAGDTRGRKLLEVPSGHQLRSSREALEVFQLVAREVGGIVLGEDLPAVLPSLGALERRRLAERERRPRVGVDLRGFWHDYLLGRDGRFGIELMAATSAYKELLRVQVAGLELSAGARVADLGSGTGELAVFLNREDATPRGVAIHALDYVVEALRRGEERLDDASRARLRSLAVDLDTRNGGGCIPYRDGTFDAALASLLISYVERPEALLAEIHRVLRSGGKLVLSTLRRDADVSKLFRDAVEEVDPDRAAELFGEEVAAEHDRFARSFLNEASRLLDLEEWGEFRFFDSGELEEIARDAGFVDVRTEPAFGDPPQAVVLHATRP